jgi:hypothetical protein
MAKRWIWLPGLLAAALFLATALGPRPASADISKSLAGGFCNPVGLSYADGTSITAVAADVQPAGAVTAIWMFLPVEARWLGYQAGVPAEQSDLQTVDRLDPVFICVTQNATINMPDL